MTEAIGFLLGSDIRSEAAGDAANAQFYSTQAAQDFIRRAYRRAEKDFRAGTRDALRTLRPYERHGRQAFNQLARLLDRNYLTKRFRFTQKDFEADPGYQFRLQEGQKAIERGAAARGGLLSGATQKALQRYGQDLASAEYGRAYGRAVGEHGMRMQGRGARVAGLAGLAGMGAQAASSRAQLRSGMGTTLANMRLGRGARLAELEMREGDIRAAGELGEAIPRAQMWEGIMQLPTQYLGLAGGLLRGGGGQPQMQAQPMGYGAYQQPYMAPQPAQYGPYGMQQQPQYIPRYPGGIY